MRKLISGVILSTMLMSGGVGLLLVHADAMKGGGKQDHPHIHQARHELNEAKAQLEKAVHDFGGHRAKALELTDQAIQELDQALEYANAHPEEFKQK